MITLEWSPKAWKQTSRFGDVLVLITRPQEAVYALQLLKKAFDEYYTTVAEYNRDSLNCSTQGYPARESRAVPASRRGRTGGYIAAGLPPPVGNGPPPATR